MDYRTRKKKDANSIIRHYGHYFGYPECCINEFISVKREKRSAAQKEYSKTYGVITGFVPCSRHATQINNEEIKDSDLIKNRQHSLTFPVEHK